MKKVLLLVMLFVSGVTLFASPQDSIASITKGDTVYVRYMVEPGETIYGISTTYGISISELMDLNPELENGLKVGQIISVPYREKAKKPAVQKNKHVVQPGETLYSVSKKYGVSIGDLLKWNGMELKAGQEIVVGEQVSSNQTTQNVTVSNSSKTQVDKKETTPKAEPKKQEVQQPESQSAAIPKPMTQEEILAAEEVYDYDSTMQQVLVIPFDPHLYFSDADDEIAQASKIPRVKVREVFRRRLDALLEPEGYEVIHLLGGQFADSVADLNKIYTSVNYNYQEILYSENYARNVPQEELEKKNDNKSFKAWMNRQKEKVSGTTNEKAADKFEGKYFGVRVKNMNFFEFYHYKYSVDYYVFINQFEVVTDYENCLDRAAQNYARYFITHFTVFNKDGKQIAGNKFKVFYNSNSNDIYTIVADNMEKVAQRVINELPKLRR